MTDSATQDPPIEKPTPRRRGSLDGFTVELGDDFGRNQTIATLGGLWCHGQFSLTRLHRRRDAKGKELGGRNVGEHMARMPDRPGTHVSISFKKSAVRIHDPLDDDPERAEAIARVYARARNVQSQQGVQKQAEHVQRLTEDQLKTLAREMLQKVESGTASLVEGELPSYEQIDALPGHYLFDPSNHGRHPKYEKDVPDWEASLDRDF